MENTKKLTGKDLINVGIYTAMTLVIFFVVGLLTALPVVYPFLFIIWPIVCGIPMMLYYTKIQKFGMLTITGIIGGIFFYLIGYGWIGLLGWVLGGILSDVVLKIGGYQKFKVTVLSYACFCLGIMGCPANLWFAGEAYWENIHTSMGDQYANTLQSLMPSWMLYVGLALLFVGGFAHPPNADAVLWFAKEIFPYIREQLPDIKFYVVGSKVTDEIKALEQPGNGIIIKGFVSEEELANLYASCKVVVVPLRYGAGVKGKVVEAIYNGAPIITTSTGAEGIPQVEQVLEVEDDPKTFADKTVALYQDNDRCRQMCEETQRYIREHFSMDGAWKVIENDFSR